MLTQDAKRLGTWNGHTKEERKKIQAGLSLEEKSELDEIVEDSKISVKDLAAELKVSVKDIKEVAKTLEIEAKSWNSTLSEDEAAKVRDEVTK